MDDDSDGRKELQEKGRPLHLCLLFFPSPSLSLLPIHGRQLGEDATCTIGIHLLRLCVEGIFSPAHHPRLHSTCLLFPLHCSFPFSHHTSGGGWGVPLPSEHFIGQWEWEWTGAGSSFLGRWWEVGGNWREACTISCHHSILPACARNCTLGDDSDSA